MDNYNLCIIKPNKDAFSETFIQEHINRLHGNKKVLYGGSFPVYDNEGNYLIKSKIGLLSYLIQKRLFHKKEISIRTNALVKYLKAQKIDVVFAEYGMVGAMVTHACKLANVPLVIHYHGADVHHRATVAEYLPWYKKAFEYASAFIAVSGDMVEELKKLGAPADKIHYASCGIDTNKFPELNISGSEKNFLAVGRFVEKKSPESVVKAFKLVTEKYPDAKLTMVGQGPLFEKTKALVNEFSLTESVTLAGILKTEEIKLLMRNARAFVQHSVTAANGDSEGTPVTILEASSSGLPVVSTRHAGIKEAVVDGVTGYLNDEHDIEAMAQSMIKLAESPELAVSMGKAARQHMIKNYDINNRIALLDSIIKRSIANN